MCSAQLHHNLYNEYRCKECSKLMFKGMLSDSEVQVKCRRCGTMNLFEGPPSLEHYCAIAGTCSNRVLADTATGSG
ncbi:Com family DNA-binding transcriptional regulator [Candidatus Uhrbacteria bacterium]|nr:Com family DNA-binding transcriptional regulator [Candidatus Uhrbacteria bacterium]